MTATPGGSMGKALAHILGDAFVHAHQSTVDATQEARVRANQAMLDQMESDYAPLMEAMFGHLKERDDLPPGLKVLIDNVTEPEHWSESIQIFIAFFGLLAGILPAISMVEGQTLKNHLWANAPTVPIAPADLADAVERDIMSQSDAENMALESGVSTDNFGVMVDLVGEPPGIVDMLRLYRRGGIDLNTFTQMLYYSRIRNEWLTDVINSAYDTMGSADALEGALKGVLTDAQAQTFFTQAGGLDDQFETLLDTTGDAIGVEAAGTLYNHKLITEDQLAQVILHSRINPIFEPMAELLRFHWMGLFQIGEALKAGACSVDDATTWLLQDGYPADQVAAYVSAQAGGKMAAAKALTESQISEMREVGLYTTAEATAALVNLGYTTEEAGILLALDDSKRALTIANSAISSVRLAFVSREATKTVASNALDSLGVDPAIRDDYLAAWTIEQSLRTVHLTAANIGDIFKKGGITEAEAITKLETMGYSPTDAVLLLFYYGGNPPAQSQADSAAD